MPAGKEQKMLVIGNPFYFIGGVPRRTYEIVKAYSELGIKVKLYIPYEQLYLTKLLQIIHDIKNQEVYSILENLKRYDVEIPFETYTQLEDMEKEVYEYYDIMRQGGVRWILENFKRSLLLVEKRTVKEIQTYKRNFLKKTNQIVDLIYVMDAAFPDMIAGYFISRTLGRKFFLLFQSIPLASLRNFIAEEFHYSRYFFEKGLFRSFLRILILTIEKAILKHGTFHIFNMCAKNLAGLFSVSDAPIKIAKLDDWAHRKGIPIRVLRPGNAINVEIQKYFKERGKLLDYKEDYAVFYARLDVIKGILDIPFIAKYLRQDGYEILLIGRFENPKVRERFERLCKMLDVKNIRYLGYLPDENLWQVLAKSKVLIYPSHCDVFPLVVLESLFLGNSVIAYNIPAIASVYKSLPAVKIVEEYDYKSMAEKAIEILKMDLNKFYEEHMDKNLLRFLELHSSWRNVAEEEINTIQKFISSSN